MADQLMTTRSDSKKRRRNARAAKGKLPCVPCKPPNAPTELTSSYKKNFLRQFHFGNKNRTRKKGANKLSFSLGVVSNVAEKYSILLFLHAPFYSHLHFPKQQYCEACHKHTHSNQKTVKKVQTRTKMRGAESAGKTVTKR